jgi:hypothetical protein
MFTGLGTSEARQVEQPRPKAQGCKIESACRIVNNVDPVLVIGTVDIILRVPGALVALRDLRTLKEAMKLAVEIPDELVEQIAQRAAEIVAERQRAARSILRCGDTAIRGISGLLGLTRLRGLCDSVHP